MRRAVLALFALLGAAEAPAQEWDAVSRIVAVGDVHGDLGQLTTVLRDAGLVDDKDSWIGGKAWLVQTGDRIDRGPDSRRIMDLLMRLEKQAKKAGGAVQALVGNHEVMNVVGDLRYVSPEEYAAFKTPDSARLQEALLERTNEDRRKEKRPPMTPAEREAFQAERPLGFVEHRLAWAPRGEYGSWIARQNAVIRVGDTLFLHGGLSPKYADFSLKDLDDRIRDEVKQGDAVSAVVATDPEGPLWFRGLAQGDPALLPHLEAVLKRHGARRMVVGHTPTEGLIFPRYGGRLVQIDVGMSKIYGGPPAALLIEDGKLFALHRGHRVPLPDAEGEPLVRYVREVAALEPDPARINGLLARLQAPVSAGVPASR